MSREYGPQKKRRRALKNALRRSEKGSIRRERRRRSKAARRLPVLEDPWVDIGGEA